MPSTKPQADFTCLSPCKLNLFLYITGRRPDGYHCLQTLFALLDYGDEMRFEPAGSGLELCGSFDCPAADNLITHAHALLQRHCGRRLGVRISVNKRIPAGAGLGGGSSNAATTLLALSRLFSLNLQQDELMHLGLQLGADVPLFVGGRCAFACGIGEELQPLELDVRHFVVAVPQVHVSTASVYADPLLRRDCPQRTLTELLAMPFENVMQEVVVRRHPEVGHALGQLLQYAPARMSGSGSACFAVFEHRAPAEAALQAVARTMPGTCFAARLVNVSPVTQALQQLPQHDSPWRQS